MDVEAPSPRAAAAAGEAKSDGPELGPGSVRAAVGRQRRCCGGVCSFVLSHWSKAALLAVIVSLIVLVSVRGVKIFSEILNFFETWNSWAGWGIFIGMFIANVTLFLPGVALILGAGFVFGFWKGLLAVWAGGAIGQALSFLLARYLVKDAVTYYVARKWKKWDLVELVLEQEGWKMVLLLRLSPLVPWNLLNIAMASTSIPFWQFTISSAIGIGFESSLLCYFGSLAQSIRDIVSGDAQPQGPVVYALAGCSLLFCFLAAAFATVAVRRALKRADTFRKTQDEEAARGDDGGGGGGETHAFLQEGVEPSGGSGVDVTYPGQGASPGSSPRAPHRTLAGALGDDSGFSSDDSLGAYGQRLGVLSGSDSRRHTVPPADSAGFAFAGSARRQSDPAGVGGAIEMHGAPAVQTWPLHRGASHRGGFTAALPARGVTTATAGDGLPPLSRRAAGGASSGDGVSPVAAIDATGRYASPLAPEGIAT